MNYYEYTKHGVVVAAVQLRHNTWSDMCNLLGDIISEDNPRRYGRHGDYENTEGDQPPYYNLTVPTRYGNVDVLHGQWVVKTGSGSLWVYSYDDFKDLFRPSNYIARYKPSGSLSFDVERFESGEMPMLRNGTAVDTIIVDKPLGRLVGFVSENNDGIFKKMTWFLNGANELGVEYDLVYDVIEGKQNENANIYYRY